MQATAEQLESRADPGPATRSAGEEVQAAGEEVVVAVLAIRPGPSPRRTQLDPDHVETLIETGGRWPPLLLNRESLVVIDGNHRLAAARRLKLNSVRAVLFAGDSRAANLEAVRRNVSHGLPLTLAERRRAAIRILSDYPTWSDSKVAEICG
jgi:ParB-like chromosome segregation protein Spo0J